MKKNHTALVLDGDFLMRSHAMEGLQREGISVLEADTREEASQLLAELNVDIVFADLNIISTMDRKKISQGRIGERPDWVITASFGTVDRAIEYVKRGAYDYLLKPFSPDQASLMAARVLETRELRMHIDSLEEQVETVHESRGPLRQSLVRSAVVPVGMTNLRDIERETIIRVMRETGGCRGAMAELLGISVRTLRNKLNQYKEEESLQLI
ncbi:MAG: response regulator [Pontiellaceae bacterium]|nr:response regulator [Pontiellaceae bacterium]MBN2784180.1 response regulator [Pontiellaceae bacterium]